MPLWWVVTKYGEKNTLITHYFLGFLPEDDNRIRIAYAASFGKTKGYISKEYMPYCRKLLHRFNAVSVREYEGVEVLQKDFDYEDGVKGLDPTLLLSADEYRKLIKDKDRMHKSKSHIAVYLLDSLKDKDSIPARVSSRLGIPFKMFSAEYQKGRMLTVSQWIAEFDNASFVITDSFHGCVFSILFHRFFMVIANVTRGVGRIVSLLRDCGLENRIVFSFEDFEQRIDELISPIDYTQVEELLKKKKTESFQFLCKAINNELHDVDS